MARLRKATLRRDGVGADVVEGYAHFFPSEQAAWDKAVTDWERQRCFERI